MLFVLYCGNGFAEYMATAPDPVAEFSAPILKHMNDDHADTTRAMVKHYITGGVEVRVVFCFLLLLQFASICFFFAVVHVDPVV